MAPYFPSWNSNLGISVLPLSPWNLTSLLLLESTRLVRVVGNQLLYLLKLFTIVVSEASSEAAIFKC